MSPAFYESERKTMNIGVISDTHGLVRPGVYDVFEGVDLILHAGDIGSRDVIIELEAIAPVKAVVGNVDVNLTNHFPNQLTFDLDSRSFKLQHIFQSIPTPGQSASIPVQKIVVFGHNHQPTNEQIGDTLYFNPGSAGPRRFNSPICVGNLKLEEDSVSGEIIHLE